MLAHQQCLHINVAVTDQSQRQIKNTSKHGEQFKKGGGGNILSLACNSSKKEKNILLARHTGLKDHTNTAGNTQVNAIKKTNHSLKL